MSRAAAGILQRGQRRAFPLRGFAALVLLACGRLAWARLGKRVQTRAQINPSDVLERLASLPIYLWRYRWQPTVPHIGSMAQDFYARFAVGDSPRRIYIVDAIGVAYAAIIALHEQLGALSEEWERARPLLEHFAAQQASCSEAMSQKAVDSISTIGESHRTDR